jgi:hypothetical protein
MQQSTGQNKYCNRSHQHQEIRSLSLFSSSSVFNQLEQESSYLSLESAAGHLVSLRKPIQDKVF